MYGPANTERESECLNGAYWTDRFREVNSIKAFRNKKEVKKWHTEAGQVEVTRDALPRLQSG